MQLGPEERFSQGRAGCDRTQIFRGECVFWRKHSWSDQARSWHKAEVTLGGGDYPRAKMGPPSLPPLEIPRKDWVWLGWRHQVKTTFWAGTLALASVVRPEDRAGCQVSISALLLLLGDLKQVMGLSEPPISFLNREQFSLQPHPRPQGRL